MAIAFSVLTFLFLLAMITACMVGFTVTAWAFGVDVREVGIGIGPALFRWRLGSVVWRINLLPLGGYTKMQTAGPDNSGATEDEQVLSGKAEAAPGTFYSASLLGRVLICVSGHVCHIAIGIACLAAAVVAGEPQLRMTSGSPGNVIAGTDMVLTTSPSTPAGQVEFIKESAGHYLVHFAMFQDLEGWGGYVAFIVQAGKAGAASVTAWLTMLGIVSLVIGIVNLLPISAMPGFHLWTMIAAAFVSRRDLRKQFTERFLWLGLLFLLLVFGRMVTVDVQWLF